MRVQSVKSKSTPEKDEAAMSPEMTLHSLWAKSTSKWTHRTRTRTGEHHGFRKLKRTWPFQRKKKKKKTCTYFK